MVALKRSPDVAVVGVSKPTRVVVIFGLREHHAPLLFQGPETCARIRARVRGVADPALSAFNPLAHAVQFGVPPWDPRLGSTRLERYGGFYGL
jgi:hypothetical protein